MPVFHSTDTYGKHRLLTRRLYGRCWPDLRVEVRAKSRKANAQGREVQPLALKRVPCLVTGDQQHDIINFRRLVPPRCGDGRDLVFDHIDLINRLSGCDPPAACDQTVSHNPLGDASKKMLEDAARLSVAALGRSIAQDPGSAQELRQFLQHPRVLEAAEWNAVFGSVPPRGTLARIARRLRARLHPCNGPHRWRSKRDFCEEARRIRKWYKTARKTTVARRGIARQRGLPNQVRSARVAFTAKARSHYRRLLKPLRLEGLWAWRRAANALQVAGIPMQTGTVPVERTWASFKDMFPRAGRTMSLEWWALLANLAFLRHNLRHFQQSTSPAWAEGDSLLAARIDTLVSLTRVLHDDDGVDGHGHSRLAELFGHMAP